MSETTDAYDAAGYDRGCPPKPLADTRPFSHIPQLPFTELVTISLGLRIKSEVGDELEFCPGLFTDNTSTDEQVLAAFYRMSAAMVEQIRLYLDRRRERRDSWQGKEE